jgi:hypothetical protein
MHFYDRFDVIIHEHLNLPNNVKHKLEDGQTFSPYKYKECPQRLITIFVVWHYSQTGPRPPRCWSLSHKIRHTRTHTHKHTHTPLGLLWTSVQPVAETAAYRTHNKPKRRTSMSSAVFEPTITAINRSQTYTDRHEVGGIIHYLD